VLQTFHSFHLFIIYGYKIIKEGLERILSNGGCQWQHCKAKNDNKLSQLNKLPVLDLFLYVEFLGEAQKVMGHMVKN